MSGANAVIITYYKAPNYGAFLQAYAMQCFLESSGIDAEISAHSANNPNILTRMLDKRVQAEVIEYRNGIQKVIDDAQKYLKVSSNRKKEYDLAVIGSDEVWNVKNMTAMHLPRFFMPYRRARRTIAYAACAGRCEVKHMKLFPYTRAIKNLYAVSVRDDHTEKLMDRFGVQKVRRTLDPAFLYCFEEEVTPIEEKDKYIFVYTYGLSPKAIEAVKEYARERNLKIIATGSNCEWADKNPIPSPFKWLALIKHSQCVITSTFHGSVFSIIFEKRFVTICNKSNKVNSLLEEFRLKRRMVMDGEALGDVLDSEIDYGLVNEIRKQKAKESAQFILDNI